MFIRAAFILLFCVTASGCATSPILSVECEYHKSKLVDGIVRVSSHGCDNTGICDVSFRYPKDSGEWNFHSFSFRIPSESDSRHAVQGRLKSYGKENAMSFVSEISGEKGYLEKMIFTASYSGSDYCFLGSQVRLKHNKTRNAMDGSGEPPIR